MNQRQKLTLIIAAPCEHVVFTTLLYIEVIFMLVNGGLLWLLFKERTERVLTPGEELKLLRELRK